MADGQRSLERLWPAALALLVAAGIGVGLCFLSRGLNRPPVVSSVDIEPPTVPAGGAARVRVAAEDPDGDALSFAFRAEYGQVEAPSPLSGRDPTAREAQYRAAPQGPIADRLTVTVTDSRGLTTTASQAVTISGTESAPTATPVPTAESEPEIAVPPTSAPSSMFAPPAVTPPPTPSATPRPTPRLFNRAPVLEGGTNFFGVEEGMVGLAATGYDPDGDPVTHKWEFGPCLVVETQTKDTADVKLAAGCDNAHVALVWTDSHGASGRTEWNLLKGEQ